MDETIEIYNETTPHVSNHYLTPNQMHKQSKLKTTKQKPKQ